MINFTFSTSFVLAICFCIFMCILYITSRMVIVRFLDRKINEIKLRLSKTEEVKNEARLILDEIKQELSEFELHKKSILQSTEKSIKELLTIKTKELELSLERQKKSLLQSIGSKKNKISDEMRLEFVKSVSNLINSYLKQTDNNSISDNEIFDNLFNKKN